MARTPGAAAAKNRPPLLTGLVGAGLAFTLFVTRAYYTAHLMRGRSGDIPNPLYGMPWLDVGGRRLMREFPDVLMILLLTFLGMAAWEKLRTPGYQQRLKLWFVATGGNEEVRRGDEATIELFEPLQHIGRGRAPVSVVDHHQRRRIGRHSGECLAEVIKTDRAVR